MTPAGTTHGQGKVLVVGASNTARSAYVAHRLAERLEGTGVSVSSAGTEARDGRRMDAAVAGRLAGSGGGTRAFVARKVTAEMVADADLVLTVTRHVRAQVVRLHHASAGYCFALGDVADLVSGLPDVESTFAEVDPVWVRASEPPDFLAGKALGHAPTNHVARLAAAIAECRGYVPLGTRVHVDLPEVAGHADAWRLARRVDRMLPILVDALTPPQGQGLTWAERAIFGLAGPAH